MGVYEYTDDIYENHSFSFFGPMEMAFEDDEKSFLEAKEIKTVITVILLVVLLMGIIGNSFTCAVIARDKTMRTPTNLYLVNLAVADLMIALFIPIEIYMMWMPDFYPLGEIGCYAHLFLIQSFSNASVLTISAFTIERYLVISKPFLRPKLAKTSRISKIVSVIWIVSLCFCIPEILNSDVLEQRKNVYCYTTLSFPLRIFVGAQQFIFFVAPMAIILALFILIAIKLKRNRLKMRRSPVIGNRNRDKAVRMLAAVAGSFFFCWFPYFVTRVMMIIPKYSLEDYYTAWRVLTYVTTLNGYLSTTVNPVLYGLMSNRFRQAFRGFLGRKKTKHPPKEDKNEMDAMRIKI